MEFFTIGVFNSGKQEFFGKLTKYKIDVFCDIRQRRGVRGDKYSFVNNKRLQQSLEELGIQYQYVPGLAPTPALRQLQKDSDTTTGKTKTDRQELSKEFIREYTNNILNKFDFETFFDEIQENGSKRIVFFCVEQLPEACHRYLVANWISEKWKWATKHL